MASKIIAIIVGILAIIGACEAISWQQDAWPRFQKCLETRAGNPDCLKTYLESSPPVQDARAIEQACAGEVDADCMAELTKQGLIKRAEDHVAQG